MTPRAGVRELPISPEGQTTDGVGERSA